MDGMNQETAVNGRFSQLFSFLPKLVNDSGLAASLVLSADAAFMVYSIKMCVLLFPNR